MKEINVNPIINNDTVLLKRYWRKLPDTFDFQTALELENSRRVLTTVTERFVRTRLKSLQNLKLIERTGNNKYKKV